MSARRIVVVGGGPAGVAAALAAKQQESAAEVVLISDERQEPYEKPPLSKAVLTGKALPEDAPIAGPKGVAAHGVRLALGSAVKAIDRGARTVVTEAGVRMATRRSCSPPGRSIACCRCSRRRAAVIIICAPRRTPARSRCDCIRAGHFSSS